MTLDANIQIVDIPEDVQIKNAPETIKLVVQGKGRSLFQLQKKIKRNKLQVPYALLINGSWQIESSQLARLIEYSDQIQLLQFEPSRIDVNIQQLFKKELKVQPDKDISFQPGYQEIRPASITPATVWVYATKPIDAKYKYIQTEKLSLKALNRSSVYSKRLVNPDPQAFRLSSETVEIQLHIERILESTIRLPIDRTGLPANLILVPSEVTISYKSKEKDFKSITPSDFEVTVEPPQVPYQRTLPVKLTVHSDKVLQATVTPKQIDYIQP